MFQTFCEKSLGSSDSYQHASPFIAQLKVEYKAADPKLSYFAL